MVPSTGIEPVTFPMSRERATAAPTGLKSISYNSKSLNFATAFPVGAFPKSGNVLYVTSAAPTGLKSKIIIPY